MNISQINLKASILHGMAQYNYTGFRTRFVMQVLGWFLVYRSISFKKTKLRSEIENEYIYACDLRLKSWRLILFVVLLKILCITVGNTLPSAVPYICLHHALIPRVIRYGNKVKDFFFWENIQIVMKNSSN